MKLMEKIKSKFVNFKILSAPITDIVGVDGTDATATGGIAFRSRNINKNNKNVDRQPKSNESASFNEIEELYIKNNEDAKDLVSNINGVVAMNVVTANEQHEAIRVSYDVLSLDLKSLIKIYSFTSGDKVIFAKDSKQKNNFLDILSSINISSVTVTDLVTYTA